MHFKSWLSYSVVRGRSFLSPDARLEWFLENSEKFLNPLNFLRIFSHPLNFPWKFSRTGKCHTPFPSGTGNFGPLKIFRVIFRPLKIFRDIFRPFKFFAKNFTPLKKHSNRVSRLKKDRPLRYILFYLF